MPCRGHSIGIALAACAGVPRSLVAGGGALRGRGGRAVASCAHGTARAQHSSSRELERALDRRRGRFSRKKRGNGEGAPLPKGDERRAFFSSIRYPPTPTDHLVTRLTDLAPLSNKERRANNLKISSIGKATFALTDVVAPARRQNRSISAI